MSEHNKIKIKEIYICVIKNEYKIWMSKLNDFVDISDGSLIVAIEGYSAMGEYIAKRIKLEPTI